MTTVYGTYLSPFVRKVLIALGHKNIDYKIHPVVPTFGEATPDGVPDDWKTISPANLIPALRDDKIAVSDSSVICEYLDERYPETSLTPTDPDAKARCHWYEEYGDTAMTEAMVFSVFAQRFLRPFVMKKEPDEGVAETAIKESIPKAFDYLETELKGKEYLVGDSLTIADISVVNPIINMHYGQHSIDAKRWPNVAKFYERITAVPAVAKILEKEQQMVDSFRAAG